MQDAKGRKLEKLGSGEEVNVFRLNDYRVLKSPLTREQKRCLLKHRYPNKTASAIEKRILHGEKQLLYSQRNLKKYVLKTAPELIGNPVFLGGGAYTQDLAVVMEDYIRSHTYEEDKSILRQYLRCVLKQWRFGFYRVVANFTIDYGVDKKGNVLILDLGELTFSKAKVANWIKKRTWLLNWSYINLKDERLKKYYAAMMNSKLTLKVLNRLWKQNRQVQLHE